MKKSTIFILAIFGIFILTLCGEEQNDYNTSENQPPKNTYIDTPSNTYEQRVENLNIANTIQNPATYLDSRVDARNSAKRSLKQSDLRTQSQDKAIEEFMK